MLFHDPTTTDPFEILNSLVYLEQSEISFREEMIPFIENRSLQTILVDYKYAHMIPLDESHTVVVDEAEVVLNPNILREYARMVVRPISEKDMEYQYVKEACEAWLFGEASSSSTFNASSTQLNYYDIAQRLGHPGGVNIQKDSKGVITNKQSLEDAIADLKKIFGSNLNMHFLNKHRLQKLLDKNGHIANLKDVTICNLVGLPNPFNSILPKKMAPPANPTVQRYLGKAKDFLWNNKGKISAGLALTAGAAGLYKYIRYKLDQKPKSTIGKRIAALRHIYTAWMEKAKRSTDPGIAAKFRKAAATILHVIDLLLAKIQNSAERSYSMGGGTM